MTTTKTVLIAGPTASGKSAAALRLAKKLDGVIINADAMQVYRDLRVLTARPSAEDESEAPHRLYGFLDAAERCSAGRWARLAADAVKEAGTAGKAAIIAGGTGLYFRALEDGLSPIPDIAPEHREAAEARWNAVGAAAFRAEVIDQDPVMARLPEGDGQRLKRAWAVFAATGKPMSYYQSLAPAPLIERVDARLVIEPPRDALYARCDARAAAMLEDGAVEEVEALIARHLDPDLPAMKALGVADIRGLLTGEIDREAALAALQQNTRRYAKRQLTWFRNQTADWPRVQDAEAAVEALLLQLAD